MSLSDDYAQARVRSLRERIDGPPDKRETDLSDADREVLIEFDEEIRRINAAQSRFGGYQHSNLLKQTLMLALETGELAASLQEGERGQAAVDEMLMWIDDQDYSGYSKQSPLSALRVFAELLIDGDRPERFERISPSKDVERDPAPKPGNIIRYTDVVLMVKGLDHTRDKALVMLQWDGGLRPMSELWDLQYRDVHLLEDKIMLSLPADTKTGRREVVISVGAPFLRKWIEEEHPAHHETEPGMQPETYIWTKLNKNDWLGYSALSTVFDKAADRIDFEKDNSPQHFRRSAASILAAQATINERDLRSRFGWAPNTDSPEHYIAAFSEATHTSVLRARGHDVEDIEETEDTAPIRCASCETWTPRGLDRCIHCRHPIDAEIEAVQHTVTNPAAPEKGLRQMIIDGDVTSDDLRSVQRLESVIQTEPQLFDQLEQIIIMAEALEAEREETGETAMATTVGGAIAWLSGAATSAALAWARTKDKVLRAHPEFDGYPPDRPTAAKIGVSWLLLAGIALTMTYWTGSLQDLAAGDPTQVIAVAIAALLGGVTINRITPSAEDAVAALLEEIRVS
ncbi:site-specific integrase [Natrinema sp. DC36]|uniref:site-specific integrase n=1 Tax=Natrinema sp. DC36 TaxID=2878680 RepID=UPI001CF09127|nr:site-specific integrase [Natrinema sp. DC36]